MEFFNKYFLDIIIAVVSLVVIFSSFFKPTFRYVRWLVGYFIAFLAVILLKAVKIFNFIETAFVSLLEKINFAKYVETVIEFFKGDITNQAKLDQATNVVALVILGLLIFIIVNVIMGLAHSSKVRRSNRRGNYVYNRPLASFILSLICVALGIISVTLIFKALPFQVNYVDKENSQIMYFTYNLLSSTFDFLHSVVPAIQPLDTYIDFFARVA